jgi:hypothetical protein
LWASAAGSFGSMNRAWTLLVLTMVCKQAWLDDGVWLVLLRQVIELHIRLKGKDSKYILKFFKFLIRFYGIHLEYHAVERADAIPGFTMVLISVLPML